MELPKLKELVLANQPPKFLILFGEEQGVMKEYVDKIKEIVKLKSVDGDSVEAFANSLQHQSLFGDDVDNITIIRNDKKFTTQENLWEFIKQTPRYLILIYDTIDKRSKFYKQLEDSIVYFGKLEPEVLNAVIKYYAPGLTENAVQWLAEATGGDYNRCRNEIAKLTLFPNENQTELLREFAKSGSIHSELPDCIFDFSNSVLDHRVKDAFHYYEILKQSGEPNMRLISVLYNSFRNQVLVQLSNNPTPEATGLTPYLIKLARGRYRCYSNRKLVEALKLVQSVDTAVKVGDIPEDLCVDYLLVRLFG